MISQVKQFSTGYACWLFKFDTYLRRRPLTVQAIQSIRSSLSLLIREDTQPRKTNRALKAIPYTSIVKYILPQEYLLPSALIDVSGTSNRHIGQNAETISS